MELADSARSASVPAAAPQGLAGGLKPKTRSTGWWYFKWTVRAAFLLAVIIAFVIGMDSQFYFPSREMVDTPRDYNLDFEDVSFPSTDGVKLHGWFIPAQPLAPRALRRSASRDSHEKTAAPSERHARGTVIHFHGNAENISTHISFVFWLPHEGYNLFVFDYRGYGQSEGRVTRKGTIKDGHAALDYVLSRKDVDPRRVFFYGQSLGGAVATVVAAERPEVRAVVLDSTFSSYRRIAGMHLSRMVGAQWAASGLAFSLISGSDDPIDVIKKISPRPLLVIGCGNDQICFPELSRELYEAAGEPKEFWLIPDANHTEGINLGSEFERRIIGFFDAAAP